MHQQQVEAEELADVSVKYQVVAVPTMIMFQAGDLHLTLNQFPPL
jgi:hypothetical protein